MIESSQLQVLMALSRASSLSEAAELLNVTQSAVSQNIKNLEAKVGFAVVSRSGKKVSLTNEGRKLAKLSRFYVKKLDDLVGEIQEANHKVVGEISLGTMFGIGKSWVASRMLEFGEHFPEIDLKITMDFNNSLLTRFENRELNCLVLPRKVVPVHYESKSLHFEKCTLVYSDKFEINENIDLKELMKFPLIFFDEKDSLFFSWCRAHFGTIPRLVNPRIVVNSFGQMLLAVYKGLGVAVVPTHVLNRSFFKDKVKTLGGDSVATLDEFHFVYHQEDKDSLKINTVYEFLLKEVKNLNI